MLNKLSFLFCILTFKLFSFDMISLNFHNLDDDGSWAYDSQAIKKNERAGTSDYSGGSTITKEWNNILSKSSDNLILESKGFLLFAIFLTLFPFIPTGNFFNNWLSCLYFIPIGFLLYVSYKEKN